MHKTPLLLQVERPTQQDVRKRKEAAVQRDGSHQADQAAPRRSVYERSLPEASLDNDGRMACQVQAELG